MEIIHHEIGRDPLYKIWNSCEDVMIIYIYTDGGSIVFQDKIYPMEKGCICFIRSKIQHYTMPAIPSQYDRSKIFISEEVVSDILKITYHDKEFHNLFINNPVVFAHIPSDHQKEVEEIFKKAESHLHADFKAAFIQQFFRLMIYLKSFSPEQISSPSDTITASIKYINQNYFLPITLDDICREVHMSKYHFSRKFKDTVGITAMQYLLKTRIASAKCFLADDNKCISEISEECGFSSLSYFCQIFKKHTNTSPSTYRKQCCKKIL